MDIFTYMYIIGYNNSTSYLHVLHIEFINIIMHVKMYKYNILTYIYAYICYFSFMSTITK